MRQARERKTMKKATMKEILELVEFGRDGGGELYIKRIRGNVLGDVEGSIAGSVKGLVEGQIAGSEWQLYFENA